MSEREEMKKFREILEVYCLRDFEAIRLCEDYLHVAHIWDDLYDKDKDVSPYQLNKAFCGVLGHIPMNPIYQAHVKEFASLSLLTALTWQIANRFESGNADQLMGSFILRNTLMVLIYFIILLAGAKNDDDSWGIDVGTEFFREMFDGFHGKYLAFLSEMGQKDENL